MKSHKVLLNMTRVGTSLLTSSIPGVLHGAVTVLPFLTAVWFHSLGQERKPESENSRELLSGFFKPGPSRPFSSTLSQRSSQGAASCPPLSWARGVDGFTVLQ